MRCEQAAIEYFGGAADLIYCASFDEVFHATASGSAQYGVVGVENSNEGVVTRSLDMFLHSPTHVVGEVSLLIRHNLLRKENSLEGIEAVLAHPQALAQCQAWLAKHLPHAERRAVSSNAEGARLAATNGRRIRLHELQLRILKILAARSPLTVERAVLERDLWGDNVPDSDSLRTHIYRLRNALTIHGERELIETVHGKGWRFVR